MLRRLLIGLVLGLIVGGLVAAGLIAGLRMSPVLDSGAGDAALAYLAAATTGVLTGLVAGKPIWASGAKVEAGLKAFFGALVAAGLMFVARRWLTSWVDLDFMGAGQGALGNLPAASLPLVAATLGGFFELDNTEGSDKNGAPKKRVAQERALVDTPSAARKRVADGDEGDAEQAPPIAPKRAKR